MISEDKLNSTLVDLDSRISGHDKALAEHRVEMIEIRERTVRCEQSLKSEHIRITELEGDIKEVKKLVNDVKATQVTQGEQLSKLDSVSAAVTTIRTLVIWIGALGGVATFATAMMKIFGK
ncbi:MAG: hypothetical protein ACQGQO_04775 [Sphaerochaetaceae bacterium]